LSCTVSLKAERSGKTWITVHASREEACIQASFTGWNLVLESFLGGACNRFWNVLLLKGTQVWENDVLMITGLQAYKTIGDALTRNAIEYSFKKCCKKFPRIATRNPLECMCTTCGIGFIIYAYQMKKNS
jgi:hypothetical protein